MPKYIIERNIPNAGKLSDEEIQKISAHSNKVIHDLVHEGKDTQWVESYITGDKLYCVYNAPSADVVREHARRGGFPADEVNQITRVIDPTSGEARA
jgi:hypothetical protein